jgi:hypothetical protein
MLNWLKIGSCFGGREKVAMKVSFNKIEQIS